ncbi:SCO3242 family prenyltransferase [Streptomyces tsukubensis]|uniref:Prenyltransferase n=1 Tax=Streptomyces tsukubensis TaxID=83656 RepID=A0A1V4ACT4_9ACTN|nr:UbiA family prenyltransferase [Streptomyces tsukubensis]OON81784.1 prenyltransferase [Streptomyces tsukubensis]QFR96573.1 prenyltransferase [Streptomyces tsukubensis]
MTAGQQRPSHLAAWTELLRVSALFTVPGDAVAGAAAAGSRFGRGTALAIGGSLCLYEAGMALNDWADRAEDAVDRPHRPIPSGRVKPGAALVAAGGLTAAGLALAASAGRPALLAASALAATVWGYDLALKHTPAGPATMAAARSLDLLFGAAATGPASDAGRRLRAAAPAAAVLGVHTLAVTAVSRRETRGGSSLVPFAALGTAGALARVVTGRAPKGWKRTAADRLPVGGWVAAPAGPPGPTPAAVTGLLGAAYVAVAGRPLLHAVLNPSPPLTQRAVGGGIRAMIPLQAALAARAGALPGALATAGLAPLAKALARKVSPT